MKINKKKVISPIDQWTADEFNGMPYRPLGNSGLRVANVGIGTWKFGYPEKGDGARVDEETAHRIFDRAMEIGATFWDTANRYYFAVSNFTVEQLQQYRSFEAQFSNRVRVLAVQNQFDVINLEDTAKPGVIDYCAQNGMSFIAWTPLLKGLLTDKYQDIAAVGRGDRLFDEGTLDAACEMHDFPRIQKLARLSKKWDITLNQLVVAYMLSIPGMGPVIPSVSSVSQLESNAMGGRIAFSPQEIIEIKDILTEK